MRIFVVLLLTAVLAWAFLKLFPSSAGELEGGPPLLDSRAGTQAQEPALRAGAAAEPQLPSQASRPAAAPRAALEVGPLHPENPFAVPVADAPRQEEVELGRMLAHGRLAEAQGQLAGGRGVSPRYQAWLGLTLEVLRGQRDGALERAPAVLGDSGLSERERGLLRAALGTGPFPLPEPAQGRSPLEHGLEMALYGRAAQLAASQGRPADQAGFLGRLLLLELSAPWPADRSALATWSQVLREAQQRHRWDRRGDWPSFELEVRPGDSLVAIRLRAIQQHPGLQISTGLIERANGLRSSVIHPGDRLRIPTDPVHVLVDLDARWMLYFHGEEVVESYPVGIGREGNETITGEFFIGRKQVNPTWFPRGRQEVPFGHPDNPLGTRWLGWRRDGDDRDTSYGFHGTNDPASIGHAASEGCIRMRNEDVERLYEILPAGARVFVKEHRFG